MNNTLKITIAFTVGVIAVLLFDNILKPQNGVFHETYARTDTVYTTKIISVHDTIYTPVFTYIPDTGSVLTLDTLWREALASYALTDTAPAGTFTAQYDTALAVNDTSILISGSFVSPLPLHKKSYFTFSAQVPVLTRDIITQYKTNSSKCNISFYAGYGYANNVFAPSFGVAVTYTLWEIL